LKRTLSILIICLILIPSIAVISESNPKNYNNDQLRFICTTGNGFNEVMYKQMVQMYESNDFSFHEEPEINTSPDVIDTGLMDSAWPMKCHDTKHSGRSPYSTADNNGAELWKFKADRLIDSDPIIGNDGTIYFGDDTGNFYALNPDGSLKWKIDDLCGTITSSPAIASDGTIYIGSWDHYLYALNSDGTLKWKFLVGIFASILGSPTIADDGTIYLGSTGLTNGTEEIGRIFAVNPDGTEKWMYQAGYKISSSPAIADDGTVYIGSGDTYLYAMNPDGTLQWRFKTGHYIKGPVSIAEDDTIYFGSYDDYLYALHPNGTMKWKIKTGSGTETNPSIGPDGTIYVGDDRLYAINPDGTYKWTLDLGNDEDIFQSSPAISADGTIYVGTKIGEIDGGDIIAVNSDGTLRWRRNIANIAVGSSPCIGNGGIVYIGSISDDGGNSYGHLYAFGHGENINNPPNKPSITGPNSGKTGESYSYTISTTDPDNDQISYYVDWGDSTNSGWQGPYSSGTGISLSHSWSNDGSFSIKAKAKDTEGSESTYTTLQITMPKSKMLFNNIIRFLQNYKFFSLLIKI
jgi:outer membrane protein assembly factor BamB